MYIVKNCEGFEILSHLQPNKLTCYSYVDAGRKHETFGSETKNLITHGTASSVSISTHVSFPCPQLPKE